MPYKAKGQCVYKADTGKKVGCTDGSVKKYLAALHANVPDAKNESTCRVCGGDGWDIEPDENGEPTQIQCKACSGQGNHKDPDPMIRKSGEPKNEPFHETMKPIKLSDIVKEIHGIPTGMSVNGKKVDEESIEIDGVDRADYPDFADAYIASAAFEDGTPLNDIELDKLNQEQGVWVNQYVHDHQLYLQESGDWRDNEELSRAWEKSDVSQDEFERSRRLGRYSRGGGGYSRYGGGYNKSPMVGITFFDVPAGKEGAASTAGLTQFKSGKWGFKHRFDPQVVSVASDREKSTVADAEKIFGKGRYWQPKN